MLIAEVARRRQLHVVRAACYQWTVVAKVVEVAELSRCRSLHVLLLLQLLVVVDVGWWWAGEVLQGMLQLVTC